MKQEAMPAGGGAGPFNYMPGQWKAGDRLPAEYRDRQYAIDDYREYQLPRPSADIIGSASARNSSGQR